MNTSNHIISFLQQHLAEKPAVIGLSGGVDSSLVAFLTQHAVGADKVHGIIMPSATTNPQDVDDAQTVAEVLGIQVETISIAPIVEQYIATAEGMFTAPMVSGNLQARIRMSLLYAKANSLGGLVVGTGNKTELEVGYFTKYGDGGVDLLPIGNLYKQDVWAMAAELGIPQQIIDKAPTAGLVAGQTDEAEMGITYAVLDAILQAQAEGSDMSQFNQEDIRRVQQLQATAQHKLVMPPIPNL